MAVLVAYKATLLTRIEGYGSMNKGRLWVAHWQCLPMAINAHQPTNNPSNQALNPLFKRVSNGIQWWHFFRDGIFFFFLPEARPSRIRCSEKIAIFFS